MVSIYTLDGYVSGVGKILVDHYASAEKTRALISLGDISNLGAEIGSKHDFDCCPSNETNFYGRDRGNDECEYIMDSSVKEFLTNMSDGRYNFVYLLTKDGWQLYCGSDYNGRVDHVLSVIELN